MTFRHRHLCFALATGGLVVLGQIPTSAAAPGPEAIRGLIVTYSPGSAPVTAAGEPVGAASVPGTRLSRSTEIGFGMRSVAFTQPMGASAARKAAASYERLAAVESAEPDYPVSLVGSTTQNAAPWGIDRIDQRTLPLSTTYTYDTAGSGVKAYIVDTGILAGHTQFGGRVTSGFTAISDGYGTTDRNGHGTHVAGTVGGTTYGVAKAVTLVPVRVLDFNGSGTTSGVISGLNWIVSNHPAGAPAVTNMSLGGPASSSLDTAVNAVVNDGVTMVVASGNSNADACAYSPARVPSAISVNASTNTDARATFSNFGACTDLYAPGQNITSAWYTSSTATATISGTSMATPHVAGAAARLLSGNPSWTPDQVWSSLSASATSVDFGKSLIGDPNRLLFVGVTATPSAPNTVAVTRGNASAAVTWLPASSPTPVTGYTARAWNVATGGITPIATCLTGSSGCTLNDLTNGVKYYVDVTATNASGTGPASARISVTPAAVASAPTGVVATGGAGTVTVKWGSPASTGGSPITSYTARLWALSSGGMSPVATCTTTSTSCSVRRLTARTRYYVDVVASNGVGVSAASAPRVAVTA